MLLLLLRFNFVTAIYQLSVDTWTGDVIMICLFVCLWFFIPLENFSLIWRCQHWWMSANFDLCSALMAFEHWWFFGVPYLLWHGASVYNGHLREAVTLTKLPNVLQWSCHCLFLRLRSVAAGIWTPILPLVTRIKIQSTTLFHWEIKQNSKNTFSPKSLGKTCHRESWDKGNSNLFYWTNR